MNPSTILKLAGVMLMGIVFWHLWAIPWCLVAVAGLAMIVLA